MRHYLLHLNFNSFKGCTSFFTTNYHCIFVANGFLKLPLVTDGVHEKTHIFAKLKRTTTTTFNPPNPMIITSFYFKMENGKCGAKSRHVSKHVNNKKHVRSWIPRNLPAFCTALLVPWDGRVQDDIGELYYSSFGNAEALHMVLRVVAVSSGRTRQKICHVVIRSCTKMTKLRHFVHFLCIFAHFLPVLVFISNFQKLVESQTFADTCSYWITWFQTPFCSWCINARGFQLLLWTFLSLLGHQCLIFDHSNFWLPKTYIFLTVSWKKTSG